MKKQEVNKTHKRSWSVSPFPIKKKCDALNLCSIVNGVTLQSFSWVWHGICSDTESAQRLPPYSEHATQQWTQKCSESVQRFLSQLGWHIGKDTSLIIVWHWHKPASPFRLSCSTEAGVWVFHDRHTFGGWSEISFGRSLAWTWPLLFESPHHMTRSLHLLQAQEKQQSSLSYGEHQETIDCGYLPNIPSMTCSSAPFPCSSVAVFLNIHDEVALWFCSWISNWSVKRDAPCP